MKSPLEQKGESEEKRIKRLLTSGTVLECATEANYWVNEYIRDDYDLEPLCTATELFDRVISLLEEK